MRTQRGVPLVLSFVTLLTIASLRPAVSEDCPQCNSTEGWEAYGAPSFNGKVYSRIKGDEDYEDKGSWIVNVDTTLEFSVLSQDGVDEDYCDCLVWWKGNWNNKVNDEPFHFEWRCEGESASGSGCDITFLSPGTYTVKVWGDGDTTVKGECFAPDGWTNLNKDVTVTVAQVDLDIEDVSDEDELDPGGFAVLNNDDDNDNDTANNAESSSVTGEDDLVKITLRQVEPEEWTDENTTVTLQRTGAAGKIKVWTTPTKGTEVTFSGTPPIHTFNTSELPKDLYVEGYDTSDSARDVGFKLSFMHGADPFSDEVKFSVFTVTLTRRCDQFSDNDDLPQRGNIKEMYGGSDAQIDGPHEVTVDSLLIMGYAYEMKGTLSPSGLGMPLEELSVSESYKETKTATYSDRDDEVDGPNSHGPVIYPAEFLDTDGEGGGDTYFAFDAPGLGKEATEDFIAFYPTCTSVSVLYEFEHTPVYKGRPCGAVLPHTISETATRATPVAWTGQCAD